MSGLDELMGAVDRIAGIRDLKYELAKLRAIQAWALDSLGCDFTAGDTVEILSSFGPLEPSSGWWPYREALAPGATATVVKIDFNSHWKYWYADVRLEREWSVSDYRGITRYWNGPVADTPDGYVPPGKFDQENFPDGRRHSFAIDVTHLAPIAGPQ
jgi:hypothetical protein